MKKYTLILFLLTFQISVFGQNFSAINYLDSGKKEFKKVNYVKAIKHLKIADSIEPNNCEIKYFLGYSYSGLEARDWNEPINKTLSNTMLASIQFEKIIKLNSKYEGEIITLSPRSKLTSLWGALAMTFLVQEKNDSALWAFKEGKRRGGFSNYFLSIYRNTLISCKKNSILFATGDDPISSLFYLQHVEKIRTDVKVIGISYLRNTWYPNYLVKNKIADFGLSKDSLLRTNYCVWKDTTLKSKNINWRISPTYKNKYLLRENILFLNLIIKNNFDNDVYFINGISKDESLDLTSYCKSIFILRHLRKNEEKYSFFKEKLFLKKALKLNSLLDINYNEELNDFDNIRYQVMFKIEKYYNSNKRRKAKKIFEILNKKASPNKFPFQFKAGSDYYKYISNLLNSKTSF